jgi:hypothetical protein
LPRPIQNVTVEQQLEALSGPAWMIMTTADAEALVAHRPSKLHIVRPLGETEQWSLLRLDP